MESNSCIVNVGIGGWYPHGTARLINSIREHSPNVNTMNWMEAMPEGSRPHSESNYGFKTKAFIEAHNKGFSNVLWCDSSLYAIKDISPVLEKLDKDGYYFIDNGYNLEETATDKLLNFAGLTREDAKQIPEITTCLFGFTDKSVGVFLQWLIYEENNLFNGNRIHDVRDSSSPSFKHCRHDQSALSLAAYLLGFKPNAKYGELLSYKYSGSGVENKLAESVCFLNCGM
jgi:prepilin-type processing-associated H-X9-DG protein